MRDKWSKTMSKFPHSREVLRALAIERRVQLCFATRFLQGLGVSLQDLRLNGSRVGDAVQSKDARKQRSPVQIARPHHIKRIGRRRGMRG